MNRCVPQNLNFQYFSIEDLSCELLDSYNYQETLKVGTGKLDTNDLSPSVRKQSIS